jgi:diguanylate cyclase (GGDEF)-like protein
MLTQIQEKIVGVIAPRIIERRNHFERLANTDFLTGLANRAAFDRAERKATRDGLAFIVFDLNDFGKVNKRLGHKKGDLVLQDFADKIGTVAAKFKARAFRLGGDEFAIICSPRFAETIRDQVERRARPVDFGDFFVSVSGEIGRSVADADSRLQTRKAAKKGAK